MSYIAQVCVDTGLRSLDRPFSYLLPDPPNDKVLVGHRVLVPFANTRKTGIVIGLRDEAVPGEGLKKILKVLEPEPVLGKKEIELAGYMQKMYVASFFDCLRQLLPPGEKVKSEKRVSINTEMTDDDVKKLIRTPRQGELVFYLQKKNGGVFLRELINEVGEDAGQIVSALAKKGVLKTESCTKRLGGALKKRYLKKTNDRSEEELLTLLKRAPMQKKVLSEIPDGGIAVCDVLSKTGAGAEVISALLKKGLVTVFDVAVRRDPTEHKIVEKTENKTPTAEQKKVLNTLFDALSRKEYAPYLLHGVTGSGKTEVFLQVIERVLDTGKGAIVLVPEISLTPQMTDRFLGRFGDRIAILHSALSAGERFDEWQRIKSGRAQVVIGARSAVFAPIENLGAIIVDESHEATYKSETAPYYHAAQIAKKRCMQNDALLVLASATPSVESYYRAKQGEYTLLEMNSRYNSVALPDVSIIDMRAELSGGNRSMISGVLQREIEKNIERKEQTILFLNRRGFSTFVSCRDCGYVATCPSCSISLTYHRFSESLNCHYCGYKTHNITVCPSCGGNHVRYFGTGTQKLEEEIKRLFPTAGCIRMDVDTTSTKNAHEKILERFHKEKIDILLGTQMVSKGLDFPNISLVGVLAADMSLNIDDFRASERTFDLITQVCGRAGRGDVRGRAVIQTYMPENEVLDFSKRQDYAAFYEREIAFRKMFDYPPFRDIITVTFTGADEEETKNACRLSEAVFSEKFGKEDLTLFHTAPAPLYKMRDKYRWRYWFKACADISFRERLSELVCMHKNKKVRMIIDINPNNMY